MSKEIGKLEDALITWIIKPNSLVMNLPETPKPIYVIETTLFPSQVTTYK